MLTPSTEARAAVTAGELWTEASSLLQAEISEATYSAWFTAARPLSFDGTTLILAVPNAFAKDWIENRYRHQLEACLRRVVQGPVELTVQPQAELETPLHLGELADSTEPPDSSASPSLESSPQFHPKYTFDSFVIGSSNRFAHAAALAVAEAPAHAYNPLFIYGGAGLGKTHLLQAIGRYVSECSPGLVIRYVSTEQFMNDFILALQRRTIPHLHSRYRTVDLLLIDDIQFLEGKERTQEEFFHTFNALHPRSQLVISSDRAPKRIPTLEERLRTRFEWGLLTDIQPPDLETRLAILQRKAQTEDLEVPGEVMSFIASRIQTNIRELEGALIRVSAYSSLTSCKLTVGLAHSVLESLLPNANEARITADLVVSVISEYFDVTSEEISSSSRSRPLVAARQMAMYLCRELTDLSLPKIGQHFGNRDHSTVVHATNKVRHNMRKHETTFEQVRELTGRIRQRASRG